MSSWLKDCPGRQLLTYSRAAGSATYSLAAGSVTYSLAAGSVTYSLAAGSAAGRRGCGSAEGVAHTPVVSSVTSSACSFFFWER